MNTDPRLDSPVGTQAQIEKHRKELKTIRDAELDDLRIVLGSREGRRLLWRLMAHCRVFASIWPSDYGSIPEWLARNSGKQDVGHFIMSEIEASDPNALFTMSKESKGGI